jgi:hypothetical protein
MPIHDIEMDPVRSSGIDRAHLGAQASEIGGEDRGGDQEWPGHG